MVRERERKLTEMNRTKVFENGDSQRLFAIFTIMTVLFLFMVGVVSFYSMGSVQTHLIAREHAVTGRLIESGVDRQKVIGAFAAKDTAHNVEVGQNALETAGYSEDTADLILPFLYGDTVWSFAMIFSAAVIFAVLFMVFTYLALGHIYHKVAQAVELFPALLCKILYCVADWLLQDNLVIHFQRGKRRFELMRNI